MTTGRIPSVIQSKALEQLLNGSCGVIFFFLNKIFLISDAQIENYNFAEAL